MTIHACLRQLLLLLVLGVPVAAADEMSASEASVPADAASLSRHPQWLKLLRYESDDRTPSGFRSAVLPPDFFLAANGATDPQAELRATIAALSMPAAADADEHAQCRFRGRYLWLLGQTGSSPKPLRQPCPAFERWSMRGTVKAVSVVLATGYLGNPASFYGHLLLKFNAAEAAHTSALLDSSVNYGALVPDGVDPVSYIVNGVLGGYDGGFSQIEFYHHTHNYSETELRDLWEYEIALLPAEVELLSAHAWELIGRRFRYFFFRENCAYRMAEILEMIDGVSVMPENRPWTIPQSVVLNIARATRQGRPLLARTLYRPSRQTQFYERHAALSADERSALSRAAKDPRRPLAPVLAPLTEPARVKVVETLIDYYRFRQDDEQSADHPVSAGLREALSARFALPAVRAESARDRSGPERSRPPSLVRTGYVYNDALGGGLSLDLRGAYYDALDTESGHIADSTLTMGEARLRIYEQQWKLDRLDFIRIESANALATGLPGDRRRAWQIRFGLEAQDLSCSSCVALRLDGGMGAVASLGKWLVVGTTIGGGLQSDGGTGAAPLYGEISTFANLHAASAVAARIEHKLRVPLDDQLEARSLYSAEGRLKLSARWETRLRYEHDVADQFSVLVGSYW